MERLADIVPLGGTEIHGVERCLISIQLWFFMSLLEPTRGPKPYPLRGRDEVPQSLGVSRTDIWSRHTNLKL